MYQNNLALNLQEDILQGILMDLIIYPDQLYNNKCNS